MDETSSGRVYDPELGRFMSADPFVQAPYNSQSYNRYSYVFNNPLSFTDPSGYECVTLVTGNEDTGEKTSKESCNNGDAYTYTGMDGYYFLASTNSTNLTGFSNGYFYDPNYFGQGALFKEGIAQANADLKNAMSQASKSWTNSQNECSLSFDGKTLNWIDSKGNVTHQWGALSGRPSKSGDGGRGIRSENYTNPKFQSLKDKGPLPEGTWAVRLDQLQTRNQTRWQEFRGYFGRSAWPGGNRSWGDYRVWLHPLGSTNTHGRDKFSIHGGIVPGSAGCIDLCGMMPSFVEKFQSHGQDMVLTVKY